MTASHVRPLSTCACLIVIASAVAGCGGDSSSTSAANGATQGGAVAGGQKAADGGGFCRAIEQSVKKPTPTSGDTKTLLDTARAEGRRALSLAPAALRADVAVLNDASDRVYEALKKVDFDYSKLTSTDLAAPSRSSRRSASRSSLREVPIASVPSRPRRTLAFSSTCRSTPTSTAWPP